jgi:hypothetical protein
MWAMQAVPLAATNGSGVRNRVPARHADHWPAEREGYHQTKIPVAYAPVRVQGGSVLRKRWIRAEERLGSLVAGGGLIWTAHALTTHYEGLTRIGILPPGPLEICAIGVLIWLHAKWRRSTRVE